MGGTTANSEDSGEQKTNISMSTIDNDTLNKQTGVFTPQMK